MNDRLILMGVIGKPHGVRGAVHVHAYTADPEAIADFPLQDQRGRRIELAWTGAGIARLIVHEPEGKRRIDSREDAAPLTNLRLFAERVALPPADDEEFYLADLIGLAAIGSDGATLGIIAAVHDFGAGASIELDDGSLLPFTRAVVPDIDLAARRAIIVKPEEVEVRS